MSSSGDAVGSTSDVIVSRILSGRPQSLHVTVFELEDLQPIGRPLEQAQEEVL